MEVQNACPWMLTAAPNWDSSWLDTQAVVQPHHGTWLSNRKMIHWHTPHTDESQKQSTHTMEFLLSDTLEKINLIYGVWKQVGCWQQEVRKGRLIPGDISVVCLGLGGNYKGVYIFQSSSKYELQWEHFIMHKSHIRKSDRRAGGKGIWTKQHHGPSKASCGRALQMAHLCGSVWRGRTGTDPRRPEWTVARVC